MRKKLPVVVAFAVAAGVAFTISQFLLREAAKAVATAKTSDPPLEPVTVHCSTLPRAVYRRGEYTGRAVRVTYPFPLHQTADPLVWEYRPGSEGHMPPTHRVCFADPPQFPTNPPLTVVGTVDHFEYDGVLRPNEVPGVVVLRSAAVARPASP